VLLSRHASRRSGARLSCPGQFARDVHPGTLLRPRRARVGSNVTRYVPGHRDTDRPGRLRPKPRRSQDGPRHRPGQVRDGVLALRSRFGPPPSSYRRCDAPQRGCSAGCVVASRRREARGETAADEPKPRSTSSCTLPAAVSCSHNRSTWRTATAPARRTPRRRRAAPTGSSRASVGFPHSFGPLSAVTQRAARNPGGSPEART
jgi:hypothetical protein